ncbi:MAG: alpha-xylosidase [Mycobacteriales bacterium]
MKFTNGAWALRKGVRLAWVVEGLQARLTPDSIEVLGLTRKIAGRGDTLNTAAASIELTTPAPDVIRVVATHHAGSAPARPQFELSSSANTPVISDSPPQIASGRLTASVATSPWEITFTGDGRPLTGGSSQQLGIAQTPRGEFMLGRLDLGVGTHVYGFGERFTPLVKNGQVVDIWQEDGGTSSDLAYKNVPFYLTDAGYGVFVDSTSRVSFEVATEAVNAVQFSVPGQRLAYTVIYGPSPKEILRKYTGLTGRPALPPAWSFGLWLSTSFTTSYDEATVTAMVEGMAERDIPMSVVHFDCFWMRPLQWCDFTWDPETFPEPAAMLGRLKARGLRVCVWINPYIAQASELFGEAMRDGFLLRRPDGSIWQTDDWQAGMGIVDFTNPDARRWFQDKLRPLLDMGVDAFKTDFGERVPTDVVYADGSDPERMHNYYTQLYNQTVFELLAAERGPGEAVLFARSATAGGQKYPVHWGGDNRSTLPSMAETLRGGLSLALSGFGFWSHDIGGFEGTPDPIVFKRWLAFGLLSSHSRLHGNDSARVPWLYDDEAVAITRDFARLKNRLMPYLFQAAVEAHADGIPVLRPLLLEFPDDRTATLVETQYLLGPALMVAPVMTSDGRVDLYVPDGVWTDLLSGEELHGPRWHRAVHPLRSLPLLVRPGSVIPTGARDDRPDYDYTAGVTLRITRPGEGLRERTSIPAHDGSDAAVFITAMAAGRLTVTSDGRATSWSVLLIGVGDVTPTDDAMITRTTEGWLITPDQDAVLVSVGLTSSVAEV